MTLKEKEPLRYGLDNHILPKKLKVDDIKCNVERVLYALKTDEGLNISDETSDEIKFATKKFVNDGQRLCSDRRNMALHRTLYSSSKNPEIKVCKFDKGRGVVLLDSDDYYTKLDYIVHDQSKFHQICVNTKVHPVIAKKTRLLIMSANTSKTLGRKLWENWFLVAATLERSTVLLKFISEAILFDLSFQWLEPRSTSLPNFRLHN